MTRAVACALAMFALAPATIYAQNKQGAAVKSSEPPRELTPEQQGAAAAGGFACLGVSGIALLIAAIMSLAAYFAPSIIALARGHANVAPILVVNTFLGWSLIGWVVALAWCFSNQEQPRYRRR